MNGDRSASTSRLLQLCAGYFIAYVLTGILVKWFTGGLREPRMSDLAYLVNNTAGGNLLALTATDLRRGASLCAGGCSPRGRRARQCERIRIA
jgi:hypothetical protein